jgi:hypothetical protein
MDEHYNQRVARNLLHLSLEKSNLATAQREWEYARHSKEVSGEACELCEHPELLYKFLVVNKKTQANLWVGSSCITRFNIAVVHEGRRLSGEDAARVVSNDRRAAIEAARTSRALDALVLLAKKTAEAQKEFPFDKYLASYRSDGHLSPKQLNTVIWQAKGLGLHEVNAADFKVGLKSQADQQGMIALKPFQRRQIAPALRPDQIQWCVRNIGRTWDRG